MTRLHRRSPSPAPTGLPLSPSSPFSASDSSSASSASLASAPFADSSSTSVFLRRHLPWRISTVLVSLHSNAKAWLYFGLTTASLLLLLSNSFTRLFRTLWSDVGDNWAAIWSYVVSFGFSDATLYIVGSSVLHMLTYWVYAALLLAFDCVRGQHALSQYKVQPTKNVPVDREKLYACVRQVLINQLGIAAPLNALTYPIAVWRGVGFGLPLPSFERFCFDIAVFLVVEELLFYYVHRAMHSPQLYGRFHKRHHEWTAPIAIATHYCHPVEHLLANLLPAMLGPFLCSSHISVIWMWQSIANLTSVNTHSGYHLPFMPSPEAHDFHHLRFNVNYGVLGILDWLHSTDATFRASRQYEQHKTFFTLSAYPNTAQAAAAFASTSKPTHAEDDRKTAAESAKREEDERKEFRSALGSGLDLKRVNVGEIGCL